jgi:Mn2+/Fe2+ NRAMP family transporter
MSETVSPPAGGSLEPSSTAGGQEATRLPPVPRSFPEYVRAMGPGIVVVLTWLGAGDLVDCAVAGGSYGYALMWVLALALIVRWFFVSAIARYHLCNQHRESVMEGLRRLHPFFPPFIMVSTIILSHAIGVYMYQGLGEACQALAGGFGPPWLWALGWGIAFYLLVSRPVFRRIEFVFLLFLGLLSVSLLGAAALSGPDFGGILAGTVGFRLPPQKGDFHPMLVATSLVGAVAGSIANLMYPYFLRDKGWTTPDYRRVQRYDLAFGVAVIIVLDLAVWVLGAEVLHPRGVTVGSTRDLASLLTLTLGRAGWLLIYLGIFAAVASSVVGNALAYSYITIDAYLRWRPAKGGGSEGDYKRHRGYRLMTLWCLFSPLVWLLSGKANFITLTVAINACQVLLLPVLAVAIWLLTARQRYIGAEYRNRPWENLGLAAFLVMALLGTFGVLTSLGRTLGFWS